jgi:pilus assembly protein CpaB
MGRRVIAIVAALFVALLGVVGVVIYAQAADGRAVQGQATQSVYIAKADVPMGTTAAAAANQQLIVCENVIVKGVPQGALTAITPDIAKLVATSSILPGEIVLASRFGAVSDVATSQVIPPGKIAITVSLADPQRIAPLLAPRSHIVIFDTFDGKPAGSAATTKVTTILLSDVEVIGVGDQTAQPAASAAAGQSAPQAAGNVALVTLALSPADAQMVVHAVQIGHLLYGGLLGSDVKVDPRYVVTTVPGH